MLDEMSSTFYSIGGFKFFDISDWWIFLYFFSGVEKIDVDFFHPKKCIN